MLRSAVGDSPQNQSDAPNFDVISNLCLLAKFNERDPDSFFKLFEQIADSRQWPEEDQVLSYNVS